MDEIAIHFCWVISHSCISFTYHQALRDLHREQHPFCVWLCLGLQKHVKYKMYVHIIVSSNSCGWLTPLTLRNHPTCADKHVSLTIKMFDFLKACPKQLKQTGFYVLFLLCLRQRLLQIRQAIFESIKLY